MKNNHLAMIHQNLAQVRKRIEITSADSGRKSNQVVLLAVSKTRNQDEILAAYSAGQRAFGENYLQEAVKKIEELSEYSIEWHFIGSIQSNKTREIASHFHWVHGVASLKHAQRLNDQRPEDMPPLQLCLQVNISKEASKSGVLPEEAPKLATAISALPNIRLRGLMALPAPSNDPAEQRRTFRQIRELQQSINATGLHLDTLSMGMSDDMEAAISEGSTMVRIGTAIFGPRA